MEINDTGAVIQLLRRLAPEQALGHAASEAEIAEAEGEIGSRLPESFRQFLKEVGGTSWPENIYGVDKRLPPGYNLVHITRTERIDIEPELPHHLIPFSPDGWGNHYCFDTKRMEDQECPVVLWSHELDEEQTPEQTHQNFTAWLADLISDETGGS